MSVDLALRLRSLTQDYHEGRLNFATYRSMRGALLDSLVLGATSAVNTAAAAAVAATQPRAGNWQQQADAITRPGKPRVADGPERVAAAVSTSVSSETGTPAFEGTATDSRGKRFPIVAILAVVLAIAGLSIWLWLGRASSGADSSNGAPATAEQGRIHTLLTQFTDRAEWSDAHLATLNTDLLELGGSGLSESAGEPWFQRFADEVRQRLKEQQALAATPLSADNSPLAALAVTVGLDLNAPDAAIHIAALPPVQRADDAAIPDGSAKPHPASASHEPGAPLASYDDGPSSAAAAAGAGTGATLPTSASGEVRAGTNSTASPRSAGDVNASSTSAIAGTHSPSTALATAQPDTHEGACRIELVGTRRSLCHDMLGANGAEGPPLALIPAGAFEMGSTAAPEEQPVHRVAIHAPFAISINEVSQGEFKQFCAQTDRACPKQPWAGDDYPMVNVSWEDARAYVAWLSNVTHHRYTLPSEAQWEYAARAGRTGLFPNGDVLSPTDAHYSMLAKQSTAAPRGQKFNANTFRLLHTLGNVREWVEDAWAPSFAGAPSDGTAAASQSTQQRVARGGSYADNATRLRLSLREGLPASTRDATTGFRIVRELP